MISIIIPLYSSARWLPVIERNVEEALSIGAEVVISDRHGIDDALSCLRKRFSGNRDVRFLEKLDRADFVENTNSLLSAARRDYVRIIPHDDDASASATMSLYEALRADPHAVLAYGDVEYIDAYERRQPQWDSRHDHEPEAPVDWNLSHVLPIFWTNRYNGAFKALIRKDVIENRGLYVRKIPKVWYSERAWLFGLGLAGRFRRAPGPMLRKRYYQGSTHRHWRRTPEVNMGGADTLAAYANDLIADGALKDYAVKDIYWNARRWVHHPNPKSTDPGYSPLDDDSAHAFRSINLISVPTKVF